MQRLISLVGLAALACGCAAAIPLTTSLLTTPSGGGGLEIHNQTDVRLQDSSFVVVRTNVVGQAKGFALLGIITMVPARFNVAMNRLYDKAQMESGKSQTLADVVLEKTSSYWILFSIPRTTVRADVVEFVPPIRSLNAPPVVGSAESRREDH